MEFKNTIVAGIPQAISAMRLSYNSGDRSDSDCVKYSAVCINSKNSDLGLVDEVVMGESPNEFDYYKWQLGDADKALAQKLISAGSEQRKFLRQIFVAVDITAPAYWWAQFDTYKVGVTRMSSSFMHRGMIRKFTADDFEVSQDDETVEFYKFIEYLNLLRQGYLAGVEENASDKNERYERIRRMLPQGYKYTSHVTMNYENIYNMIKQRASHRLKEWNGDFIKWAHDLPYANELLFI